MFQISLTSKDDATAKYIKIMLVENANRAGINLKVTDIPVNDVEILNDATHPTVNIDGTIISKGNRENIDFFRDVNAAILKAHNYGNMKKIIVPIDFSACSQNALEYAKALAKGLNGVIKLVFIYDNAASIHAEQDSLDNEFIQNFEKRLNHLAAAENENLDPNDWQATRIEYEFGIGNVPNEIVRIARANEDAIIVMGSQGQSGLEAILFGSVTTTVIERSKQPVIIIPPTITYEKLDNLVYCSNEVDLDKKLIFTVLDIVKRSKPHVHILHIDKDKRDYLPIEIMQLARFNYPSQKVSYDVVFGSDVHELIKIYCNEKQIDMIALSKRDRGFFEGLFHKSFAKELKRNLRIPLLVVHEA